MDTVNVVFLGVGIMPNRVAGDKNFLLELSACLNYSGVSTQFVSIAEPPDLDRAWENSITFIPRPFHRSQEGYYHYGRGGEIAGYHHQHGRLREWLELSVTLIHSAPKLRRIVRLNPDTIVHWVDLTLMMPLVRLVCGGTNRYVCSALRYVPQGRMGNRLRADAMNYADAVITATEAAKALFVRDGCDPSRIFVAPWGSSGAGGLDESDHAERAPKVARLLWAGFIQQIGKEDFLEAIALAQRVTRKRSDLEFTFCLKPESFRAEYLALEQAGIRVTKGDKQFIRSLSAYDGFFSPVLRTDSTLAPPLTWIEALSAGLPILTTRAAGVGELLTEGYSAFIFDDYPSIEAWLVNEANVDSKLQSMRANAREEFLRRYSMQTVGARYLEIYRRLLNP